MRRSALFSLVAANLCLLPHLVAPHGSAAAPPRTGPSPAQRAPDVSAHDAALHKALLLGGTRVIWAGTAHEELIGLEIRGAQATDETLETIGQLTELRMLLLAPLEPSRLTDRGLARLAGLTELEYLGLGGTGVTDEGLKVIQGMPRLKRIELPGAASDASTKMIAALPELEQLRVWPAKISNRGLAELAKNRCLRTLDLSGTRIDDRGVALLGQLDGLELLDLRNTRATAASLALLQPKMDEDLMYARGPHLLRKLYLNNNTVLDARQVDDLIRLLGMCEIDASRPQPEPGKPPRPAETVVPELTSNWLDRAKLEGYRLEISYWRALGAYVEFTDSLELDPAAAAPAELLEPPMTAAKLQQLTLFFRQHATQHITGLHFIRPRSKDERPRDDSIFPAGLGNRMLPPSVERMSFRDTEITVTTFLTVIAPAIRAGVPLKVINVYNTATRSTESLSKEGQLPFLGSPARGPLAHIPFNPGQVDMVVPGVPSRPTLTPEDLKNLAEALSKLDALIMNDEQAERFRAALPDLAEKVKTRPRYLPNERRPCAENPDGTLKPPFCGPNIPTD